MSHFTDIDDTPIAHLRGEIERRAKEYQRGYCPYCHATLNQPSQHTCKWADKLKEYFDTADPIRVQEGGERLYAFPFAYYASKPIANQFHYLCDEQYPYAHDQLASNDENGRDMREHFRDYGLKAKLRWWWALGPGKRLWWWKRCFGSFRRAVGWRIALESFWRDYRKIGVFLARHVPDIRLHLPRQLEVVDSEHLTDTVYLQPTDKWVEQQLEKTYETRHVCERSDYAVWRTHWSFCAIGFLLVIDT